MEKLKQDIFSMFPSSSKSSSSYSVPVVTYKPNTPAYETPEPESSYNAPEVSYNAPEPSYSAPSASYETYSPPTSSLFQVEGKPHVSSLWEIALIIAMIFLGKLTISLNFAAYGENQTGYPFLVSQTC